MKRATPATPVLASTPSRSDPFEGVETVVFNRHQFDGVPTGTVLRILDRKWNDKHGTWEYKVPWRLRSDEEAAPRTAVWFAVCFSKQEDWHGPVITLAQAAAAQHQQPAAISDRPTEALPDAGGDSYDDGDSGIFDEDEVDK